MGDAGFCRTCGQNVWLTPEGDGTCGHPAAEIDGAYQTPETGTVRQTSPADTSPSRKAPVAILSTIGALIVLIAVVVGGLLLTAPDLVVHDMSVSGSVREGEELIVTIDIANEGIRSGTIDLVFEVEGEAREPYEVRLGAGERELIEVSLGADSPPGYHRIDLVGWEIASAYALVMTPAEFAIGQISVVSEPVDLNTMDGATILVRVDNIGETDGSYTIHLELDGEAAGEREVSVAGESSAEERFEVSIGTPGIHTASVGDTSIEFPVFQISRPANGTVLLNQVSNGSNRLEIVNNRSDDTVVVYADPTDGTALLAVYVQAGSRHTIRGIRDGTYTCYYTFGTGWCTWNKCFTDSVRHGRFEDDDVMTSTRTTYRISTVTFGGATEGASATESVDEEQFPTF